MPGAPRPSVPGEWADRGACKGYPIEWWFPTFEEFAGKSAKEARADAAVALRICVELCPVRAECLCHAVKHREYGMWGGTTERQRQDIRMKRWRAA